MKSYAIYDKNLERIAPIGYLFYYEKSESFVIELCEDLDEWEAPILFQKFVREHAYTIPREVSLMWIRERVIPSGRQNIGSILKNHRLKQYSEIALLELSKGKCLQDECYIAEITEAEIPESIKGRMKRNIRDCFLTDEMSLICMFQDDVVKKVEVSLLFGRYPKLQHLLTYKKMIEACTIGPGGYSIIFDDAVEIQSSDLRKEGEKLPLRTKDFISFLEKNVIDTTKACDVLQCSRQNLSYMVKEDKIGPIVEATKEKLYLKGDVEFVASE